ncbi:MAG: HNH endonuclease signature motif containing protein [Corynebacterium sp.]|uniref:HNH endonuclease signature motif containing protein n=1 Tax=Corynebacterium sp. TaxID=1720 RepID=UPI0026E0AE7A|nr:HNH endonuclease signature motif containing protein [Corynebacterium sp.]MDO5669021.1 HNH endonuclease signature motif containing protein [Corynebacterium sp.]
MTRPSLTALVDQIQAALTELAAAVAHPTSLDFDAVHEEFARLEKVSELKSFADAAFAYAAEQADAGRLVGAVHASEYLTRKLGLSKAEARSRLDRGHRLFHPPEPDPLPDPVPEPDESEEQRRTREAETARIRQAEEERRRRAAEAQERARKEAQDAAATAEKQRMIQRELEHLNKHAALSREELLAEALAEAKRRSLEDLRVWLRERIRQSNKLGRMPNGKPDPWAAHRKRKIVIGPQDADGGARISMYLAGAELAALKAALAPGRAKGTNTDVPVEEDKREISARMADQLAEIIRHYLTTGPGTARRQGIGSIVVSMTAEELNSLSPTDRFPSNTGDMLSTADILRLGAAAYDLGVLHDTNGQVLNLGRTVRSASVMQRLALFAQELCCTRGPCQTGLAQSHIHHITAWAKGGRTDIEHLTILCPTHHPANRDERDGAFGLGHMDKDPTTGQTGWVPPDGRPMEFNESAFHSQSAGAKIRRRRPAGAGVSEPPAPG